ncbi:MAG: hypothetical protein ACREMR_05755 [Gemmatimonadales bacterium]
MTALPTLPSPGEVREAIRRLSSIPAGGPSVVSCYLKLEPRDKTRGKYLIKMKNRVKEAAADLARRPLARPEREAILADLERVHRSLEDPSRLPRANGIALFACGPLGLFDTFALPRVHRSRLAVEPTPLVRELVALDQEFGRILVAACDRTGARFFEVTAFEIAELPGLVAAESTRAGKFHGERQLKHGGVLAGAAGEHHYHMRIREEKHRHYARVAERIFQRHSQHPYTGLVVAGIGVDAAAVVPHLHTYLHDLLLGVVKLNPKQVTAAEVREAALALREERGRAWERAHAEAVRDGVPTGWAVNGVDATIKALGRGQVRTLLADGQGDDPRIDDAVEEALRQRTQVDVLYDERARRSVDRLAGLLRFRR